MQPVELRERIGAAARDVLETMFFTLVEEGRAADPAPETPVAASVRFTGDRCGTLALALTEPGARNIAANFLGEEADGLREEQVSAVLCELANMICGAAVSRLDGGGDFLLDAPAPGWRSLDPVCLELPLGDELGLLRLAFHLDAPEPVAP
jgi:CheY-specific phosphatase CheX